MSGKIVVAGLGPGPLKYLTQEARDALLAESEIYFRVSDHPVFHWLRDQGKDCFAFEALYGQPGIDYFKVYQTIVKALVKLAKLKGQVTYALPGNPFVFEKTPLWLKKAADPEGIEVKVILGISFLEMIYAELGVDPGEGLQVLNAVGFGFYSDFPFTEKLGLLLGQVGLPSDNTPTGESNVHSLTRSLLKKFPGDHQVTLIWNTGMPDFENRTRVISLSELERQPDLTPSLTSLYVPPLGPPLKRAKAGGGGS